MNDIENLILRARNALAYTSREAMIDTFIKEGIDPATATNAVTAGEIFLRITAQP